MEMTRRRAAMGSLLLIGPLATTSALAHHSVANFDLSDAKRQTRSGTVVVFEWQNPHSWVFVDAVNQDGSTETWAFELSSPNYLRQSGLRYDSIDEGDMVTVEYAPEREGRKAGLLTSITWDDGRSWQPTGSASPLPPPGRAPPGSRGDDFTNAPELQDRPPSATRGDGS